MKKVLIITTFGLISIVANAENNAITQNDLTTITQTEQNSASELVMAKNEANNLVLWDNLDINKDGLISKTEAVSSKDIFENWDKLDANKDEKLDTEEFALLVPPAK